MASFFKLAAIALLACAAVATPCLARVEEASLNPEQTIALAVAKKYAQLQFAGAFEDMCHETMAGNAYFNLLWNPSYVPWGGLWESPSDATNCPSLFTGFAESWSAYADWAIVTHLEFHAVNTDGTAAFGTLTLDSTSKATGNALTNITVAHTLHIGQWNGNTVATGLTLVADSAAMAQGLCTSNKMVCVGYGASSTPQLNPPLPLSEVKPPVLHSVKGSTLQADDMAGSVALHNVAKRMSQPLVTSTSSAQAANLNTLQAYWGAIFQGNFSAAEALLSPTVTLQWHGQFDWVPVAGTFVGRSGWAEFFGAAAANTRNFTIQDMAYEGCLGSSCTMTWKEFSISKANNRVIDGFVNWVNYVFTSDNLIQHIDVLVDSMSYATAFCDGFVTCSS